MNFRAKLQMTGKTGINAHNWRGLNRKTSGYIMVSLNKCQTRLHRLIYELHHGVKLTSNDIVHHIDHDKKNNEVSNLQLMTRAEHASIHRPVKRQNIIKATCLECQETKVIGYLKHNLCRACYKRLVRHGKLITRKNRRISHGVA